jgi:hypothetical protein
MSNGLKGFLWIAGIIAAGIIWLNVTNSSDTANSANVSEETTDMRSADIEESEPAVSWHSFLDSRDDYGSLNRENWDCGYDDICDGHEAGYDWGDEHTICDLDYDNGNSEAFNEGVRTYAYENCYLPDMADQYEEEYGVRPSLD